MGEFITISLDAMGGDHGPSVVVPAAVDFLRQDPETRLILVGLEDEIRRYLGADAGNPRIRVQHASQVVTMDELPSKALRNKKDSSMRVAINLVKEGEADACVSAGNTGALMATARFVLKTISGIDRPAIMAAMPSMEGETWMLDLGANVDCSDEHMFQFAAMGSELVTAVRELPRPRVGLLNIGEEEIKGNEQVKLAHERLSASSLNYIGYVEGDDIYKGGVDVVVCDGFVGNVSLKSVEGVAKMIGQFMKEEFNRNLLTKLAGLIALPVLRSLRRRMDPRRYNGASLLGLKGIVVKSHGGADVLSFENAIRFARKEVLADVPNRIARQLDAHLSSGVAA
ncbi:MAG: phosphate acyltransferase PlsX [Gammaproteobacteria bacterium]|nr:phosphate acyltransferase PlsX [Gammaproteobacteria bacterium]MBU1655773.1 phosphate acyltransferase PlsX [Gammaproteobacteria bacterium]MBU1961127.1 phosphate acyltransferase PlsX [Gammaproteobacteria bacterium]